jgi:hypothetical protein
MNRFPNPLRESLPFRKYVCGNEKKIPRGGNFFLQGFAICRELHIITSN